MGIFSSEKKPMDHGAVDSIIGAKAKFRGELVSNGAVSVTGQFEGKIESAGEVMVAKGSKITGDIKATHVVVSGKVEGNIVAAQGLEITKSGRVHGDLTGGRIIIEDGSSYHGRVKVEAGANEAEDSTEKLEELMEGEGAVLAAEEPTSGRI